MNGIDAYEWLAGKLIVRAAKARHRRAGSDDAHEMRHLLAAVTAGNSSNCDHGRTCHLDAALMQRLHDGAWPEHDLEAPMNARDGDPLHFEDLTPEDEAWVGSSYRRGYRDGSRRPLNWFLALFMLGAALGFVAGWVAR